ncbi:50S ribosome-binding GTPase domain-containing protein [Ditylenchus destructor]|uniref:Guanine nucleotide-binding protein-like 3 homolog n=1 Tax=Ditylenchus destructor TaxID=166010 RepID=A0AAD4NCQ6_9BILA|nr:50S ribosome-binding GTPase domain-containing protein [Ditylenchus destructor]
MAKYCLKKPSKRMECRKRHKIEKKVKDHNRKLKKEGKVKNQKKGKQIITVPNKCPFKEELLAEAEKRREDLKCEKQQKKADKKEVKVLKTAVQKRKSINDSLNPSDVLSATTKTDASITQTHVKAFAREVRKTVEMADVIIEVLDCRDPLGSRSRSIEEMAIRNGKRVVLLLNKIDLVPKENVAKWIAYLRKELPTIAFKASTQEQNNKLGRYQTASLDSFSSKCMGANLVMKLLGNYCRNKDIKTSIRVGIVGYPNVGKSSVINSLKRKKSCLTGAVPGLTRHTQEIELDKHIRLIDSPGVVLASKDDFDATELALKNALRIETLEDPAAAVNAILRRCSVKVLMMHYTIPEFSDCDQFLALIGRKLGRMKKGGRPDLHAAAKHVLHDWNQGKLRYYTEPPEESQENSGIITSEVLSSFTTEFDLDAIDTNVKAMIDEFPESDVMQVETVYNPYSELDSQNNVNDTDEEMEHNDKNTTKTVVIGGTSKKKSHGTKDAKNNEVLTSLSIGDGNVRLDSAIKQVIKKRKKHQKKLAKKNEKLANSLSETLGNVNMNMDYDFAVLE